MSTTLEARLVRRVHAGLTLDVTLTLGPERGVLFGASGAGKTTVLRLIAGLDRPDGGFVRLGGETLFDAEGRIHVPLRRRRIGLIFQDDLLFPHLSVARNVGFGLKHWPRPEARARLAEVAALCGVQGLLDRRPATLSGGERQRVGLARALAPRPRLLLCDEPVSALDLVSRHALLERLRVVQEAEAVPLLYVTHSPTEAVALGTRLFLLAGGTIVAQGAVLDTLTAATPGPPTRMEGLPNVLRGTIDGHAPDRGSTSVRLDGGPVVIVPFTPAEPGRPVTIEVRADDILLALGPIPGLSARNLIAGTLERVLLHDSEAEVLVRTGAVHWIVSVVAPAVTALDLRAGRAVTLIFKARSCHLTLR